MENKLKNEIDKIFQYNNNESKKIIPKKIMIEVTNSCNSKCIFCANRKMTRKRKNIDRDIALKALEEGKKLNIDEVGFYVCGEPLLNPNLVEYIEMAKKLGYKYIYLTTNGILADKEKVKKLFENGLNSIKFSINSINPENYKKIHGVDCFNIVYQNLRDAYDVRNNSFKNCKIYVSYIKTKYNNFDDKEIKKKFSNYCDEIFIQQVRNQGGLISNIQSIKIDNLKITFPCYYPFNTVVITCEGYISACCMDFQNYLVYGDLNKDCLENIWNNNLIKKFRQLQMSGKLEKTICNNCINNTFDKCEPLDEKYSKVINYKNWENE